MSDTLLITGANGRLGRLLAPFWAHPMAKTGGQVVLAHRHPPLEWAHALGLTQIRWAPQDGAEALRAQLTTPPRAMLALAGATPSTPGDLAVTAALARDSVRAAQALGIGRVLLASSSAIYGAGRDQPWSETDRTEPTTPYGHAKQQAEHSASDAVTETALNLCALRIGNVAGADALLTNPARPLVLDRFADGSTPLRSYIGPESMARVIAALAQHPAPLPRALNLAAPRPVSMGALAQAAGIDTILRPAPRGAIARLTLDTRALQRYAPLDDATADPETLIAEWRASQSQT